MIIERRSMRRCMSAVDMGSAGTEAHKGERGRRESTGGKRHRLRSSCDLASSQADGAADKVGRCLSLVIVAMCYPAAACCCVHVAHACLVRQVPLSEKLERLRERRQAL